MITSGETSCDGCVVAIPEIYDRLLVPLIFKSYALDVAKRVAQTNARNILEIAAGTGALTRAMTSLLPKAAQITATDLNQSMLDFAAARAPARDITWRQANALALPFEDGAFGAVICQFGVMFFPDEAIVKICSPLISSKTTTSATRPSVAFRTLFRVDFILNFERSACAMSCIRWFIF